MVTVLLVIAVIAAIVFEFSYDSRIRFQLADHTRETYQALYCAEAGLAVATAALEQARSFRTDEELVKILSGMVEVPMGAGYCTVSVAGERGKINVNGLKTPAGQLVRARVDQLLRLIDLLNAQYPEQNPISYGLVPAIIDWVDPDDDVTVLPFVRGKNAGAESNYYQGLEKPYACKNGPLDVLGELMLVKGMTREAFRGGVRREDAGPTVGIEQFLTPYGDGKLNINEASVTVLQTLSEQIDRALAERIVQHRPYGSLRELSEVPGMTPEILKVVQQLAAVQSGDEYYTVTTRGVVGKCVRTIRVVVRKDRSVGRFTPLIRWEL